MMPELLWEVGVCDGAIVCQNPQGEVETMPLSSIVSVKIETSDSGPLSSDVWWLISSRDDAIVFPSGADGEHAMLAELQKFPGFDNDTVTRAMCSVEPNTFVCFTHPSYPQSSA